MRRRTKRLRVISDAVLFTHASGKIEAQEQSSWVVERVGNPIIVAYRNVVAKLIRW